MINLPLLVPQPQPEGDATMWATITQLQPLRIKLDGESVALPFTPTSVANDIFTVNDRVLVMMLTNSDPATRSRRVIVIGKAQTSFSPLIGEIRMFGGSTAPSGWSICDGAALNRTTEAGLFAVIGTTYGVGDGSTTFNIPNLKGKVPVGRDSGDGQFDVLGETGGEKNHTLTTSEIPSHDHPQYVVATNGSSTPAQRADYQSDTSTGNYLNQGVNTGTTGGGGAHNNLQPYIVLNYIIRRR